MADCETAVLLAGGDERTEAQLVAADPRIKPRRQDSTAER